MEAEVIEEESEESEEEEAEVEAEVDVEELAAEQVSLLKVTEPNKTYFKGKLKGSYNSNFQKVVEFMSRLVDTIPLDFRPEGVRIWSSFLNMVGVVEITLDKSDFAAYELAVGDDVMPKFYVKSATLLNALKMAGSGADMEIKGNAIVISEGRSRFSVPLLEGDSEDISEEKIGELKFAKTLEFSADSMAKIVSQMRKFVGGDDNTTIKLDINGLRIKLTSGDLNKAEDEIALTKGAGDYTQEASLVGSYSADLLKEVLRIKSIAYTAKLSFQNDYPLRMDFSNGTAKGMIVLAPRVTDN